MLGSCEHICLVAAGYQQAYGKRLCFIRDRTTFDLILNMMTLLNHSLVELIQPKLVGGDTNIKEKGQPVTIYIC